MNKLGNAMSSLHRTFSLNYPYHFTQTQTNEKLPFTHPERDCHCIIDRSGNNNEQQEVDDDAVVVLGGKAVGIFLERMKKGKIISHPKQQKTEKFHPRINLSSTSDLVSVRVGSSGWKVVKLNKAQGLAKVRRRNSWIIQLSELWELLQF